VSPLNQFLVRKNKFFPVVVVSNYGAFLGFLSKLIKLLRIVQYIHSFIYSIFLTHTVLNGVWLSNIFYLDALLEVIPATAESFSIASSLGHCTSCC
jgi:hypothetical protein